MFRFEYPLAFFLLLFIPLYYVLRNRKIFLPKTFPLTLSDWGGSSFENSQTSIFLRHLSRCFFIIAYSTLVFALASPVVSRSEKIYTAKGAEVIFVLDSSPSMSVKDIDYISRFDSAKMTIQYIVSLNTGISFGLTVLADEAVLLVPPTLDHDFLTQRINTLAVGELGDGTALGMGISTAVYNLRSSSAPKKTIIVLTDGENNAGAIHPLTAAELARKNNISVFVVGIGSQGKATIEYVEPSSGKIYTGQYDSSYDVDLLKELASAGGGAFFTAENQGELTRVLQEISEQRTVEQSYVVQNKENYYYAKIVFLTLVFTVLAWLIRRIGMREIV